MTTNKKLIILSSNYKMFAILPLDVKIIIANMFDINYYLKYHKNDDSNKILINANIGDTLFFKLSFFDEEFLKLFIL
jgi:hypothetical protein